MINLSGKRVVVIGSAPLKKPVRVDQDEVILAVNGGIGSFPLCDIWVLNARGTMQEWGPKMRDLSLLMLSQGAGRRVDHIVMLTKGDNAEELTLKRLRKQGTLFRSVFEVPNETRRAIELRAGGRDASMTKHALSSGLFGVCLAFDSGAASVRTEGFSWAPGYAYAPTVTIPVRGHSSGDKQALARLMQRYPGRLTTTLVKESHMASKNASRRKSGGTATKPRAATKDLTPAAERARKTAQRKNATQAAAVTEQARRTDPLMVRATELTYYDNKRRRPGEVFRLRDATHYRESCMERVDPNAPALQAEQPGSPLPPASPTSAARAGRDDNNPLGV